MLTFSDIQAYINARPWIGRWLLNKYSITTAIFGIFFLFVGDQSVLKHIQRARQMRSLQQQIDQSRQNIVTYKHELDYISNPDSLERYAREHYNMHTSNEDVYVVE